VKLKKCSQCKIYTLKNTCPKCKSKEKTIDAHYKFVKVRDAPKSE